MDFVKTDRCNCLAQVFLVEERKWGSGERDLLYKVMFVMFLGVFQTSTYFLCQASRTIGMGPNGLA